MRSVTVVGGGPAGSAAAIGCAQAGFEVTLIEGEAFPRQRPGETLHPGVEVLFRRLGIEQAVLRSGFLRQDGIQVEQNGAISFQAYGSDASGPWLGFQARRSVLDALLLERARQCGVRVLRHHRARKPILVRGRVGGVLTDEGPIKAGFTLDATGSARWLCTCLRLANRIHSPRCFAQFGYMSGRLPCSHFDRPLFRHEAKGWVWLARIGPDLYHWTRLVRSSRVDPQWRPPEFAGLHDEGKPQARDVTWRHAWPFAGPGWFLLGDAAMILDPSSSHGVLRALMSGMMAAHLLRACRTGVLSELDAMQAYQHWLLAWFHTEITTLQTTTNGAPQETPMNVSLGGT